MTSAARNDLERLLGEMHQGRLEPEDFARRLMEQQVFMPVKDEKHKIAGFQTSTKAEPLVVDDDDGNRVLVLFSVPERAKDFLGHYPGYSGGLVAEFPWVLRRVAAGMGVSINPGEEQGFDFDSDMIAMLMTLLPEEAQQGGKGAQRRLPPSVLPTVSLLPIAADHALRSSAQRGLR